ncbi:MAG: minor extracellular serine protease Vpr [Gaiellaceae bacterium]|nr:minor extracellular serine protease Vpr [Gaiellaceae bacterium]
MPTRPPREPFNALVLAALAVVATAVLIAAGGRSERLTQAEDPSWQGLAGAQRPRVAVGQRVIVVLKSPSLADRVGRAGGLATSEEERQWTQSALSSQKLLVARLRVQGVVVQPEFSYTRTLNGFSAAFDARGIALLERAPDVAGVYPVRAAYPASLSSQLLTSSEFGERPNIYLSDKDGRGVTIALLDTGVDRAQPFLRGRVTGGIDIVGGDAGALAAPQPDEPVQLERHGTELAGLLVGSGGPGALAGVAPGATLLPIRVAGWQRDATANWAVYGRTDQVLAGLERAVDPNGDGDAHDAARVALVGVAEPFAGFADSPGALAAAGATRLDTLVVAPAGNDGPAGPGYGSVAGPGGAPAALTVGAVDLRSRYGQARVVLRAGLRVDFDGMRPLAGSVTPSVPLDVGIGGPRAETTQPVGEHGAVPLLDFFDRRGASLVAGRAALLPAGEDPNGSVANAAEAGAVAVLFYGADLPAGGIGLDESAPIPAVSVPEDIARTLLRNIRNGIPATVSLGAVRSASNNDAGRVTRFSSTGLAFDGRVKPELVAPGVALESAEPGANTDGSARYGTVNGTSASAALVTGAAALLAQARPYLDADALKSLLVGAARPLSDEPVAAQGAGLLDLDGATATEVAASPASLGLGRADSRRWRTEQELVLRNVSFRRLLLSAGVSVSHEGAAAVQFDVQPQRFSLGPGRSIRIHVRARVASKLEGTAPADGVLLVTPVAGREIRVPWTIVFGPRRPAGLASVRLSAHAFTPSDAAPALLSFVAGSVVRSGGEPDVLPLSRLDLELWSPAGGRIGLLARLRDVLPGRYSFGVTGRDPTGAVLPSGDYQLHLVAFGTDAGAPTIRTIGFTIK